MKPPLRHSHFQRAFTLLEMTIVIMVLIALISTGLVRHLQDGRVETRPGGV